MGGCISSPRDSNSAISIGKNQSLKSEKPKWKSDVPLTDGQLRSKRDEFWDTAPAFEGRKEIWDALKAAAYALETGDHQLAQAIVDGASITLPNGTLMDSYDELGARYQLPVYVLSAPTNVVDETSDGTEPPSDDTLPGQPKGAQIPLKFRLSNHGQDVRLTVSSTDTVLKVKRQLHQLHSVEPAHQRWFFGGRLINDKSRIEDAKIPKGCLVQVIVSEPDFSVHKS